MDKERKTCVICNSCIFTNCFSLYNTINIVTDIKYNPDEVKKLIFISCINCGCVQLQNLFLQSEIYSQPLQIFDGPAIRLHHDLFCDFVINNVNYEDKLFEIGGSYGNLAKRIINKYKENNKNIKYTILEYSSSHYPYIQNVEYVSGDCEMYNYNGVNTIIMSHVFEHLYLPRKFIDKIRDSNVNNIFISIPDMDNLSINGDINNLNILHTFYINTNYIVYLFNIHGFTLKTMHNYKNNSVFYYFKKESVYNITQVKCLELPIKQQIFYEDQIQIIKNINIDEPFYICPSGFYGQFVYFYLNNNTKKMLLGFLDGDPYKINKRLTGTELNIFEKKYIKDKKNVIVLVSSFKHAKEIKEELFLYNEDIVFHYLK